MKKILLPVLYAATVALSATSIAAEKENQWLDEQALTKIANNAKSPSDLPVEYFFKRGKVESLEISPSGEYFSATVKSEDRGKVVTFTRDFKVINIFNLGLNRYPQAIEWLNDDRIMVSVVERLGSIAETAGYIKEISSFNVDGSKKATLFGRDAKSKHGKNGSAEVIDSLSDDPKHVLISLKRGAAVPTVYKMNVYTGNRTKVAIIPGWDGSSIDGEFITDQDGAIRLATRFTENSKNFIYYRNTPSDQWVMVDEFDTFLDGSFSPISFAEDNKHIYFESTKGGKTEILVKYNPDTRIQEEIYQHPRVDIDKLKWAKDSDDKTKLIGVVVEDGIPDYVFFDEENETAKLHRLMQSTFPGYYVRPLNKTKDGKTELWYARSDKDSGQYFLYEKEKGLEGLITRTPWLRPDLMADMKPISIKARDGLEMYGYLTLPKGKSENLPLVVHPHGGPHGPRDRWGYNKEVQFLASRGYAVLQINFRGSGGYGQTFEKIGYGEWGQVMQDDLTDATNWAIEQGIADKNRLCISGASYGGYAALMGVIREPDLYKCAVGYVGVYDLEYQRKTTDGRKSKYIQTYLSRAIGNDKAHLKTISAAYNVDKIKADVFIVHGGKDARVPWGNAERLADAFKKIGKSYDWMLAPKEGHGFRNEENNFELYTRMEEFFDRNTNTGS